MLAKLIQYNEALKGVLGEIKMITFALIKAVNKDLLSHMHWNNGEGMSNINSK